MWRPLDDIVWCLCLSVTVVEFLLVSSFSSRHCSGAERTSASQHSSGPSGLHWRGPWEGAPGHYTRAHLLFLIVFFLFLLLLLLLLLFLLLHCVCHHMATHHLLHVHHLLGHPPVLRQSPEQPPLHGQPHDSRDLCQAGARGRWGGFNVWERGCWLEITLGWD